MSDSEFEFNKNLENEDFGSNSDSSVGIKDFGADVSELSDNDNINTSGEDVDEDELVNRLEKNVLLKKKEEAPIFVDEFGSEDEDMMSDNIDDINKNDNKIKIFKQNRTIYHNGRFYKKPPRYNFSSEIMIKKTEESSIRNIAFIGPFKSGKTTLVSNILLKQHRKHFQRQKYDIENKKKYLDNSLISKYRKTTCRMNMGSFLHDEKEVVNVIDTPGHSDLWNETYMACDLADFVYIVIDAVEGFTDQALRLYNIATKILDKKVGFIINKVDRLILEVKLDEVNFYFKLMSIVNQINTLNNDNTKYSPELGNVLFSSSKLHFMFSIEKFLKLTNKQCASDDKVLKYMTARCWGSIIFNKNCFSVLNESTDNYEHLTFVQFIAKPLYNILLNGLTYNVKDLKAWVKLNFEKELMSSADFEDINDQLIKLCECIFEIDRRNSNFKKQEDDLIKILPILEHNYDKENVEVKAYKTINYDNKIWVLCKVIGGIVTTGTILKYGEETLKIDEMAIMGGRYTRTIKKAYPNQIILLRKVFYNDDKQSYPINKMLYKADDDFVIPKHKKVISNFINEPVIKVGLQPKLLKHYEVLRVALDIIKEIYPDVRVEENEISKMFFLHACGELQLDIILFEIRYFYMGYYDRSITDFLEVKSTANLITNFKEGCAVESFASIPSSSKQFNVSIVATPLNEDLSRAIAERKFNPSELLAQQKSTELSSILRKTFKWESGISRCILSIKNTVFLVNDILADEVDEEMFEKVKIVFIEAFNEICESGPLAQEPINNTIFKLMSFEQLDEEEQEDSFETLKETFKNACKIALLSAKPTLYEPYFEFSVITNTEYSRNMEYILRKRRGCEIQDIREVAGSKLIEILGTVPCIDSAGLNVDLLLVSNGSCLYQTNTINRIWQRVEGDVMDTSIELSKLEPAKNNALGRDFLMKTRKRKDIESKISSLNDSGPSLEEYIDKDLYLQLKEMNLV